ncbi:Kinase-like protein [Mycena venus]|uniref:Kinase-like protein n=1 Tax=Mycena venus TaxID=2733690 RepID=A0A8H7CY11_9AGAR|nr:Kinase-like protein [Mycena venus]
MIQSKTVNISQTISGGTGGPAGEGGALGQGGGGGIGEGPRLNYDINTRHFSVHLLTNYRPDDTHIGAFRTIRLGDINLLKEIRLNGQSGAVGRRRQEASVRRMYYAKLEGRDSGRMTVAIYQGDGAQEEWGQHVAKHESIRHPNIAQVYGLVRTGGLRATVFHDELIPFQQFLDRFRHSPILTAYIHAYSTTEWNETREYCYSSGVIDCHNSSFWVRPTGQLCLDLVRNAEPETDFEAVDLMDFIFPRIEGLSLDSLDASSAEAEVISSSGLNDYLQICSQPPIAQFWTLSVSTRLPMCPGSIIFHSTWQPEAFFKITGPPSIEGDFKISRWYMPTTSKSQGEVMDNSWIRHDSRRIPSSFQVEINLPHKGDVWLAQANHFFAQCQITSHFQYYVFIEAINFSIRCLPNPCNDHEPQGYLFLCPPKDFRSGPVSFQWPTLPAYWSLDPSGATPLSNKDATTLGFPMIHIGTFLRGSSWNKSVYEGLHKFHRGKGFNPESPDVAIYLGSPLYELSGEVVGPFACEERENNRPVCDRGDPAQCLKFGHYL